MEKLSIKVGLDMTSINKDLQTIKNKVGNTTVNIKTKNATNNLKSVSNAAIQTNKSLNEMAKVVASVPLKFAQW